jgi:hypothetical protein
MTTSPHTKTKKTYDAHITGLGEKVNNGMSVNAKSLVSLFKELQPKYSIAVGSGGSITSAVYFGQVVERLTQHPCIVLTPLELISSAIDLRDTVCLLFSAEGKNPDILKAFEFAKQHGAHIHCIVNHQNTPLEKACAESAQHLHYINTPNKDGFLATESIVSTIAAAISAYRKSINQSIPVFSSNAYQFMDDISFRNIEGILFVYSPRLKAAALDFESRAHESGLIYVQIADLRNFAHGRHFGAYQNREKGAIFLLSDDTTDTLAQNIISTIGNSLLVYHRRFRGEWDESPHN